MLTLAAFAIGLFCGVELGAFSLIISEIFISAAIFVSDLSAGFAAACAGSMKTASVLMAGFLAGLVCSALMSKIKPEAAYRHLLGRREARHHWLARRL